MTQLGAVPGEFHIPAAVSLHSHRTRTLKSGDAFGVFDTDGDVPGIPYSYAGVPWFCAACGRDALVTALQTLWIDPPITYGVLAYLAKDQATATDPAADAEPGKILHEVRHGGMAELGEVPFRRYYGSVDSTPPFVMLAGAYLDRTGDLATAAGPWPNILEALAWPDGPGRATGTATASSSITGRPRKAWPTRAGKKAMTPSSVPMAPWRRAPLRSRKCRATPTLRAGRRPALPVSWAVLVS